MNAPLKVTAKLVRALYPNPSTFASEDETCTGYCVGGAFMMLTGATEEGFVTEEQLKEEIWSRTAMTRDLAEDYAHDIIMANDDGNFDEAFDLLEAAIG